ncbi:MAG: type VI secretion system baseplate subunit TssK [Deltaproteobacteria bacterium]|nr:type VI secretion system baseplate subunit TssK [Deltaproteobacteria bacterium]
MSYQRPIYWQQGTFLEPQHFQIQDVQSCERAAFLTSAFHAYPWGFYDLEIDHEALSNFVFQILRLDLWLPDGRRLALPGNVQIAPRSFAKSWTNTDEPLWVALAVPIFSKTSPNVNDSPLDETLSPFGRRLFNAQSEPEMLPDLLGNGPEARVDMLYYNAYLLFGDEASQPMEAVTVTSLARLTRDGEKVLVKSDFAPPAIRLFTDNPLRQLVVDVLEILKAKGRQLEEYKLTPARSKLESNGAGGIALVTVLIIVCRYIARLHYLLVPKALHPYTAFSVLRELAAELTVFAPGLSALGESLSGTGQGLSPYDHTNPYPAFEETKIMIARLLDSVSLGPEMILIFKRETTYFSVDLPSKLTGDYICWLSIRSGAPRESLADSLTNYGKLAAPSRVEQLIAFNLPGIALTPLAVPPFGLPRSPDITYFSLRQTDPMWSEALKSRRLTLFWDKAPEGTIVSLAGNHT